MMPKQVLFIRKYDMQTDNVLYGHVIPVWARYSVFPLVGPAAAAGSLLS